MPPPSPSRATALRSCVVNAVRESEALMARLVQATTDALGQQEQDPRSSAKRDAAGDARRLLDRHGPALVRGYPMALLEICAEPAARSSASPPPVQGGPSSARLNTPSNTGTLTHFGPQGLSELTLLGEEEVQAQVEMSRAQQQAVHANDAVLAELDTLMSAAQGLDYVQPERNPLRPYSYLRALQQVVSEAGVALPVRESWMQILCSLLGGELTDIYQQSVQALRSAGIAPVGYARGGGGGSSRRSSGAGFGPGPGSGAAPGGRSRQAAGYGGEARISQYHSGGHSVYLSSDYDSPPWNAQAEEALLTVSMLRQMLAQETGFSAAGISTLQGGGQSWERNPAQRGRIYRPGTSRAELEALEDMEVLEQLVTRLSQDSDMLALGDGAPHSRGHRTHSSTFRGSDTGMQAMPTGAASRAAEIVARMVETMVEEGGLLPPVQRAIQNLEPAVRQLVRHDTRFFNDNLHPARCLLDEITERSLAFSSVHAPGFDSFMQLVDEAVRYLSSLAITNAQPFDIVLAALQAAWETQEKKRHAAQQQALAPAPVTAPVHAPVPPLVPVPAMPRPEASHMLQPQQDPAQPQVQAVQQQQQEPAQHPQHAAAEDGTNAAWQEQPQQPSTTETVQAAETAAALPAEKVPPQAAPETSAAVPEAVPAPGPIPEPAPAPPPEAPAASAISASPAFDNVHWVLGVWVEMESAGRSLRTQLTWVSPQQTLFMFTGPDGSTQSMTRRVRDKLASTGALRIVPAGAPAGKSASANPAPRSRTAFPPGQPTRR